MASYDDTATVSGSVVSFSNGADDVPLKSCEVALSASLDGYSSVDVVQTGRNLFTDENKVNGYLNVDGDLVSASGWYVTDYIEIVPNTEYTFTSGSSAGASPRTILYDKSKTMVQAINTGNRTFTTPSTAYYIRISYRSTDTDIQLEVGSTATAYEPYTAPTTHTVQLGRTIYGGQVDVVNGEGTETYNGLDLSTLTWSGGIIGGQMWCWYCDISSTNPELPSNSNIFDGMSDNYTPIRFNGVSNTADTIAIRSNGVLYVNNGNDTVEPTGHVTYKLATPIDFTFTGQEIPTRLGYNAFWSEHGNTELTYYKSGYGFTSVTVHKETPEGEPVVQTAKFHRIVYGGQADVVKGTCEPKNLVDFLSNIEPTYSGFTITVTSDYGINFSGTGTRTWAHLTKTIPCDFDAGTKLVFSIQEDKDYNIYVLFTYEDSSTEQFTIAGIRIMDSVAFTLAKKAVSVRLDVALLQASTEYNETLYCMIEKGTTKTDFAPYFAPFTFQPISMETDEGENTLSANEGDSSITYRKAVD